MQTAATDRRAGTLQTQGDTGAPVAVLGRILVAARARETVIATTEQIQHRDNRGEKYKARHRAEFGDAASAPEAVAHAVADAVALARGGVVAVCGQAGA